MVRLLMRDARSSPSATSFRTVDRAHWSFALTCATDNSFETGIVRVLGSILRAITTVRTLPVSYVAERRALPGVDAQIGQDWIDRFESRK